ncbi:hypothetical protein GON03_16855 [Nocardioides sp. MAH-18]|uniref:WD40 repeat domain-containing protein n=1 Tax=Nocardioides agri TaxID=2682843 RepID=A0A6L6XUX4_9ACTN|nr:MULTISPECIES: hypothetical protein [unclassified Nocardioides]MBA2956010.1 hypothetical protein [Nocardioides sp. CGMCC 1.13656]MVQ50858.1 hypothetical protein [Nocardioides sp. MAH-18]
MVTELQELLRDTVASPPPDHLDVDAVIGTGRRRVRRRRTTIAVGVGAVAVTALVAGLVSGGVGPGVDDGAVADHDKESTGPVLALADARPAVEGRDLEVLATHTNEDLDRGNGAIFAGVTDDGLVVYTDGPHTTRNTTRVALLDPATGEKDWLPGVHQVEHLLFAGTERLVFQTATPDGAIGATVFDRATRTWSEITWPGLDAGTTSSRPGYGEMGADDGERIWVTLPEDADWHVFDLWSGSLDDPADIRLERSAVDPRATPGPRCDLAGSGQVAEYLAYGPVCAASYGDGAGVRVVTPSGDPLVDIRGESLAVVDSTDAGLVLDAYAGETAGTYAYLFGSGALVRIGPGPSGFPTAGPIPGDYLIWDGATNDGHGATQWVGRLLD